MSSVNLDNVAATVNLDAAANENKIPAHSIGILFVFHVIFYDYHFVEETLITSRMYVWFIFLCVAPISLSRL